MFNSSTYNSMLYNGSGAGADTFYSDDIPETSEIESRKPIQGNTEMEIAELDSSSEFIASDVEQERLDHDVIKEKVVM